MENGKQSVVTGYSLMMYWSTLTSLSNGYYIKKYNNNRNNDKQQTKTIRRHNEREKGVLYCVRNSYREMRAIIQRSPL